MPKGKQSKKPGARIAKPAKPVAAAKPTAPVIAKPAEISLTAVPAAVASALDAFEQRFFTATTPRAQDPMRVLASEYGSFRVYQYDSQGNPADKHTAVFFFNSRSDLHQWVGVG